MSRLEISEVFPSLYNLTISATEAAPILGASKSSIYNAIKDGSFPFPVIRIGERIVIPTAPIREALRITDEPNQAA